MVGNGKECRGLCYRYYPHAERDIRDSYLRMNIDGVSQFMKKCMECEITLRSVDDNNSKSCKCCYRLFRYSFSKYIRKTRY